MMQDLRSLIRQVLAEELAALRAEAGDTEGPKVKEEAVSIRTNGELAAFVDRLMQLARDPGKRAEIESGRHVFRLEQGMSGGSAGRAQTAHRGSSRTAQVAFEQGLLTERDVAKLPDGQAHLRIGAAVRLTPLAQDELRRRGITIERTKP